MPAHKQPLSPRPTPPLAPARPPSVVLLLLTGRHLICTSALFSECTGRWRPLIRVGSASHHRTCRGMPAPALFAAPLFTALVLVFGSGRSPKSPAFNMNRYKEGARRCPCSSVPLSLPSGLFHSKCSNPLSFSELRLV